MARYNVGESPFMKRVLVPFWVVRILVMLIDVGAYALLAVVFARYRTEFDDALADYGSNLNANTLLAITCVILVIIAVCLILDVVCIIQRCRRALSPPFFLVVNVLQTTIWTVLFILAMVGARTGVTLAVGVITWLSFFGLLVYASVIYHKHRRGTLMEVKAYPTNTYAAQHLIPNDYPPVKPDSWRGSGYGQQQHV